MPRPLNPNLAAHSSTIMQKMAPGSAPLLTKWGILSQPLPPELTMFVLLALPMPALRNNVVPKPLPGASNGDQGPRCQRPIPCPLAPWHQQSCHLLHQALLAKPSLLNSIPLFSRPSPTSSYPPRFYLSRVS
jgi:hypothetical protein